MGHLGAAAGAAMDSKAGAGGSSHGRRPALQHNGSAGEPALAHRTRMAKTAQSRRDSGGLTWICKVG